MASVCTCKLNLFILYCVLTCVSTSAFTFGNTTRFTRQIDCGFICSTGQCISKEVVCDGHEDCKDGNDETIFCKNLSCRDFYFRCEYGACLPKSKICNRQTDCRDNSDESFCNSPTKDTTCDKDQFECSNGQCISSALICNGLADCTDKSDETQAICSKIVCPKYTYRCDYGACISTRGKCNGIQDCLDNSDEEKCGGGKERSHCPLPITPENGSWELGRDKKDSSVTKLPDSTVIYYKCNEGYKLAPEGNVTICIGTQWEPNFKPKCLRICPTIESTEKLIVKCYWKGQDVSCLEPADGTYADFTCKEFYEIRNVPDRQRRCVDGTWDLPTPKCQPICGLVDTGPKPLIPLYEELPLITSNVPEIPLGKYPWHAAIYAKYEVGRLGNFISVLWCTGTMLNERVILTAANCMSYSEPKPRPKEFYEVAIGKHFIEYNKTEANAQFSNISGIYFSENFTGLEKNYEGDIAILILKKKFKITRYVQPICFDEKNTLQLIDGQMGVAVGWHLPQEKGKGDDILRELFMPVTNKETCKKYYPTEWAEKFFIADKMCAGYVNRKIRMCSGSSGTSLSFRNTDDNRVYVQGVLSLGGPEESKDSERCLEVNFGLFTKVARYRKFIEKFLKMYPNS